MPSERPSDVKFEIGHVLFIDIVGYSKLLINEQSEQIQKLKEIVRGTEQWGRDQHRPAFSKARAEQEKIVQAQPDYGPALCVLGLIDAALGRKEAALQEGRRAIELLPVEKDSVNGSLMIQYFAVIAAWTDEKDLALQQLEIGVRASVPSQALTYGGLKLLPFLDPVRGDPRIEQIVASLAPKTGPKQ